MTECTNIACRDARSADNRSDVLIPWRSALAVEELWPLAVFAGVSTVSPGGATTLATASGANFGFKRSVPLMAGIAVGLAAMAAAASMGLATLLMQEPSLQTAMRAAGSAYMLWLALAIARSGAPGRGAKLGRPTSFVGGMLLLWANPKGWAMTLSAAAAFAALASGPAHLAMLLGVAFGTTAAVSLSLWCIAGQVLAALLRSDWQWRALNVVLGFLLAASVIPLWR
jgi:threonine/homoserine/homoserine lactone efflux protein